MARYSVYRSGFDNGGGRISAGISAADGGKRLFLRSSSAVLLYPLCSGSAYVFLADFFQSQYRLLRCGQSDCLDRRRMWVAADAERPTANGIGTLGSAGDFVFLWLQPWDG